MSTARLEALKEGLQVCEARIFLEDALLDDARKATLGADLAKRCQDALDVHHRAMWKTVWSNDEDLNAIGVARIGRFPVECLWGALEKAGRKQGDFWGPTRVKWERTEPQKGQEQFVIGWQDREKKLFALAGEAAIKLNPPR